MSFHGVKALLKMVKKQNKTIFCSRPEEYNLDLTILYKFHQNVDQTFPMSAIATVEETSFNVNFTATIDFPIG